MGHKRKTRNKYEEDCRLRKKIRRLRDQLHYDYSSNDEEYGRSRSPSPTSINGPLYSSDWEDSDEGYIKSVVSKPDLVAPTEQAPTARDPAPIDTTSNTADVSAPSGTTVPSTNTPTIPNTSLETPASSMPTLGDPKLTACADSVSASLPTQILEALGEPKAKDEPLGPKIQEEIAKRWDCVLLDGLGKEQKQALYEKNLFPENFKLAKAPALNPELAPVLSESVRNRDKLLEKSQNILGRGISGLSALISSLIEEDVNKVDIIRRLSEVSQLFLDLHHDNMKTRRKLIMSSLDKKFTNMIADVKRDEFLFGNNLGDKIKASKTAERSGLQVRRTDASILSRKPSYHSGNFRGPPRHHGPSKPRRGGPRNRYWPQQKDRRQPAAAGPGEPPKPSGKPRRPL